MAKIEGEVLIGRPVEAVFDFVADRRNERSGRMTRRAGPPRRDANPGRPYRG
jgi:hypothetical protein